MAAGYIEASADSQSYIMSTDMNVGFYDGASSDSSASSPMNCNGFENVYGGNGFMTYQSFPMQYPAATMGLIPVELDIEGLYEDHDRRRRKNGNEKTVSSHVHSRRRAQNRASQRAFRDRKEKHMRELEERLKELEGRHSDLTQSYESLQLEYSSVKQELEKLRKDKNKGETTAAQGARNSSSSNKHWEEKVEILDPLLFDVSAFCFDQEDSDSHRG